MNLDRVLSKTQKGFEELETRAHRLSARFRPALFMVDGQKTVRMLLENAGAAADQYAQQFAELEAQGFLVDLASQGTAVLPKAPTPAAKLTSSGLPAAPAAMPTAAAPVPVPAPAPAAAPGPAPALTGAKLAAPVKLHEVALPAIASPADAEAAQHLSLGDIKLRVRQLLEIALGAKVELFSGPLHLCRTREDLLKFVDQCFLPIQELAGKDKALKFWSGVRMVLPPEKS